MYDELYGYIMFYCETDGFHQDNGDNFGDEGEETKAYYSPTSMLEGES